jgi:membrane protein DedA with SNARE-associated domain
MKPRSYLLFVWVGVALWLVVTVASVVVVIQSPGEHVELAVTLALIWVLLLGLAAFSRLTERTGHGPR